MDWEKLYHLLFNRITDALGELEQRNYGTAETILRDAQQDSEAAYIEKEE